MSDMPRIESYAFGEMIIDGQSHTSDLIIYPDGRVEDGWWRASGHELVPADITALVDAKPDFIIAGTGASGLMKPSTALRDSLDESGILLEVLPTEEAMHAYNRASAAGRVGACFHLTC